LQPLKSHPPGIPRFFEAMAALAGLVATSPLLLLATVLIRATSPGPFLFRQERIGQFGRPFTLLKFRSMHLHDGSGHLVTAKGDSRVTFVGQLLRKTKLDELPELWNVARGDLSLVGPRPEVSRYVNLDNPVWRMVLEVRPGITDPVTLRLRNEEELLAGCEGDPEKFYLSTLQPYKLSGYVQYLQQRTWRTDVRVLIKTLLAVILPSHAPLPDVGQIEALKARI
jgi:lipopolysaccharide/colanic/teichoic acid biosynthesis glycosyltransferase